MRRPSRTQNLPNRLAKHTNVEKNYEGGYVVYAMDFGWTLHMRYMYFVCGLCIYNGLCGIYDFRRGLSFVMRLA